MIRCTVALDSHKVAPRNLIICNCQIDEEPGDPDLRMDLITPALKCGHDLLFEHTIHPAIGPSSH
ncbi:hypothetical protein D3C80_1541360 [compost metagenome]